VNCEVETLIAEFCVTAGTGHRYATFLITVFALGHFFTHI